MSEKREPKFGFGEMFLGFVVGLCLDGLAALADAFSFGFLGWFVQSIAWPFIKNFWLNKGGGSIIKDQLRAYVVPILVQAIPLIPTMCATILVVMYLENHPEKLGIINKGAPTKKGIKGKKAATTRETVERGETLPNTNEPRIFSIPKNQKADIESIEQNEEYEFKEAA